MSELRKILVLGAGRVGAAMALDLATDPAFDVTVVDASTAALDRLARLERLHRLPADLADGATLDGLLQSADLVVGAVPGPMGHATLRHVLEAGRSIVDISFFEEDAFSLDQLARDQGCVAIVDCGVAPGCSNLILGHHAASLDRIDRFWCAVGGLPVVRHWPYEYRAPFSPIDVIAEYTRPARLRRGGREVVLPALSEIEIIDLPGVGSLEAFNTDGLRTLLHTVPVPDMVEKTLRYPGHAERMRMLRETGFFATEPLELSGTPLRPLDLTSRLLFEAWRQEESDADLTVMRVIVEGRQEDRCVRHTYDLLDHFDRQTGTSSMARTTGYTCTAAVRLLSHGLYRQTGITPPELLGREPGCWEFIMAELAARGVIFRHTSEELGAD